MPYENIAVALAGKKDEISMIDEAVRLAITLKAKLSVIHVNEPRAGEISMMMDSPKKFVKADFVKMFADAGHEEIAQKIKVKITANKSVSSGLAKLALGCNLLIIGHSRLGKLREALTDSIDEIIMNNVHCPVLIIHKQN